MDAEDTGTRPARPKAKNKGGTKFLIFFGIPFALVGLVMVYLVSRALIDRSRMQSWAEVPAQIEHAALETHDDSDSTTYKAVARYTYEFAGRTYTGTRVGLVGGSDNLGSYQQTKAAELKAYMESGKPFRCYVDPEDPSESILYPELRFFHLAMFSLMALLFGGAGFGMMIGGLAANRAAKRESRHSAKHPDQPWLWKADWAAGTIRSGSKKRLQISVLLALFWNLGSLPVLLFIPGEIRGGNQAAWIAMLFPAIGVGLILWAARRVLIWIKYGESIFQMASVPGVIGGPLSGVARTKVHLRHADGFRVALKCLQQKTTRSGKRSTTTTTTLWEDSRVITRELLEADFSQSAIPVQFAIPFNLAATSPPGDNPKITWRLTVSAKVPGVDYSANFDVPVYKTAKSSPDFQLDGSKMAGFLRE